MGRARRNNENQHVITLIDGRVEYDVLVDLELFLSLLTPNLGVVAEGGRDSHPPYYEMYS